MIGALLILIEADGWKDLGKGIWCMMFQRAILRHNDERRDEWGMNVPVKHNQTKSRGKHGPASADQCYM